MKKPLVLIVGRTATGKDTLAKELVEKGFSQLLTYTTRPQRKDEGDTHIFIRPEEISNFQNILFQTTVGEYTYFTTQEMLDKRNVFIIDPVGAEQILQNKHFARPYVVIYLEEPYDVRKQRFMARDGSSEQDFQMREDAEADRFDTFERRFKEKAVNNDHIYSFLSCDIEYITAFATDRKRLREWSHLTYKPIGDREVRYAKK